MRPLCAMEVVAYLMKRIMSHVYVFRMGFCTFMKTVEVTRHKEPAGAARKGTWAIAYEIFQREGIRGLNKARGLPHSGGHFIHRFFYSV